MSDTIIIHDQAPALVTVDNVIDPTGDGFGQDVVANDFRRLIAVQAHYVVAQEVGFFELD
ncbi:hypothetical protein D3C85_1885390 [compost metagenome]